MKIEELVNIENTVFCDIPKCKPQETTFLSIIDRASRETSWSHIYAFFFKKEKEHGFSNLFIVSLLEILNKRGHCFDDFEYKVKREFQTKKGNFIDLLLIGGDTAIIIENKVHHTLENDFVDYFNSANAQKKIGILFTLYEVSNCPSNFVNITHLQFLETVFSKLSSYTTDSNHKYVVFLEDFFLNVKYQTNPMEVEVLKFCFKHNKQINEVCNLNTKFHNYVVSESEKACSMLYEKLRFTKKIDTFCYYSCPSNNNLMLTIYYGNLITGGNKICVIVELQNEFNNQENKDKINSLDFTNEEQNLRNEAWYTGVKRWTHFAFRYYELQENDILNLSKFIADIVNESELLQIYRKIKTALNLW